MLSENEILNEFWPIKKLCVDHSNENLVGVYWYGKLPDSLHYIDTELCELNLEESIHEFEFNLPSTSQELPSLLP